MGDVTIEFELNNGKIQSLNDFAGFLKTFILMVYDMMNILIDIFAVVIFQIFTMRLSLMEYKIITFIKCHICEVSTHVIGKWRS